MPRFAIAIVLFLLAACAGMGPSSWEETPDGDPAMAGQAPAPGSTQGPAPAAGVDAPAGGDRADGMTAQTEPAPNAAPASGADPARDYELGAGDRLRVIVYKEEELSGEFQVDGTGMVSMPLIGPVRAEGLTTRDFETAVEDTLRGRYIREPDVSAEVLNFRPYYILGEVNRPGTYPYSSGLTVMNAVATAEGYTYRANKRVVYIRRAGEEGETRYPISSSTQVRPGDTIRIGERLF